MTPRHLVPAVILLALAAGGCIGPYKASVVEPKGVTGLAPMVEDPDVGLVGVSRGFDLRQYSGSVAGDAFDATGMTADQRVQTL